ncbi:MAG: hypothetical protein J5778_09285, partial [Clostridiales bacterium]|nr:hypothetical protein [Clostridiales bacterium]
MKRRILDNIVSFLAVTVVFSMLMTTACSKAEPLVTEDCSAAFSATPATETSAPAEETTTETAATTEETEKDPSAGTPETTSEPFTSTDNIFGAGDKEFFVPFSDPEHSYCLINEGVSTPVREQGWGGCYAYSAVTSMQSEYLKEHGDLIDINPVDIIDRIYEGPDLFTGEEPEHDEEKYYISSGLNTDLGGDIFRVTAALCASPLNGYLVEGTDILGSYKCEMPLTNKISEEDIKAYIREKGAVSFVTNYKKECKMVNGYYSQNYSENATDNDHLATIIGWDDNYPKDGFKTPAKRDGAWLVQNSFGEFWGNCGFYWVSYDMPIPELNSCHVTKDYSSAVSYGRFVDCNVLSDDLVKKAGKELDPDKLSIKKILKADEVCAATVFDIPGKIAAIGIWTPVPDQPYTIEILDNEFGDVLATVTGTAEYMGYHTVKLPGTVEADKYTVVVKMPGAQVFEGSSQDINVYTVFQKIPARYEVMTEPGRSFIKIGGEWVDVTTPDIKTLLGFDGILY